MFNAILALTGLVLASREDNTPAQTAIATTLLGVGLSRVLAQNEEKV